MKQNNPKSQRIVFFTLDALNPNIISLLIFLKKKFNVIVVTNIHLNENYPCKHLFFNHKQTVVEKFFLMFYKNIKTRQEKEFFKRNYYRKFKVIISLLAQVKYLMSTLKLLPYYSSICKLLYSRKNYSNYINKNDICIVDANLRHTLNLNPLIVYARKEARKIFSIVYSWDNTHYSTLNRFSDGYFVWNYINKNELIKHYNIQEEKIHISGSLMHDYLFEEEVFLKSLKNKSLQKSYSKEIKVLYAGVFPESDEIMFEKEINFISDLADLLKNKIPNFKIIFRRYPSKGKKILHKKLADNPLIEIYDHHNFSNIPRLGNLNENISFERDAKKKIADFFEADVLISAGSTYTLEFAFSNKPILHLDANFLKNSFSKHSFFFERLANYQHLDILSKNLFKNIIRSPEEIFNHLINLDDSILLDYNKFLSGFSRPSIKTTAKNIVLKIISEESLN